MALSMRSRGIDRLLMTRCAAALVLATGCGHSTSAGPEPSDAGAADVAATGPGAVSFPRGFRWGAATAAFQVESNDTNTDWSAWVAMPGKISNGDSPNDGGPDSLHHFDEDIAAMKAAGITAYRFSVEWARIYPTAAAFEANEPDPAGIGYYDALLSKLRGAGIEPMVTLHHFASPDYLADVTKGSAPQAWERPDMTREFVTFAARMAARWGAQVDYWITINEPVNLALGGYLQGSFPPGQILATDRMLAVLKAEARAHAGAYDAIHQADTVDADGDGKAALVSLAAHQRTFHPYEEGNADDIAAAARVEYVFNDWVLNAIVKGDWDDDFDGALTGPKDVTADPKLVGRADFVGVNYYSDTLVSAHRGLVLPIIDAAVYLSNLPTARAKTDFGWDIYPEGLGTVLDKVNAYGLPVIVTENGLADAADVNRSRFLLEHLYEVGWAIARGVPVMGYFHWALVDNFEWANGYCPHFGLLSYDKATGARTARSSMATYRGIIERAAVLASDVRAASPYRSATTICQ